MSWPEVKKINSDFVNEPLNFNNYINDISTFGKYSYALDTENETLWLSLISQSLTLYGHDAIHDTVYERFTDEEVDYMITKNARLGQSFNSFYSIDDFASGPIDTVLKSITIEAYNKLDIKFQNGINRYISAKTSENAGAWLTSEFGIDMRGYQTMDDLLADTAFWTNTVESNESLRFVISLSVSSAEYMASHTDNSIYVSFIETVAQSTDATMTLINALAATAQLETFFANESVCTAIANSAPSMTALCYNTDGFAAMIASETAMTIVAASETAVNVIVDGIANAANSESVLDGIKGNLTSIEESLPSIANTETVIAEVADVKENISGVVTSLQKVTSQADILIENIDALLNSETAMTAFSLSDAALKSITSNEVVMVSMATSEKAMVAMAASNKAMLAMYENAELITPILADSDTAYNAFYNASTEGTVYNTGAFTTGKTFLVCVRSQGIGPGYGYFITGNSTRGFSTPGDTETKAMLFASKLSCTSIGNNGGGAQQWARYIEIS